MKPKITWKNILYPHTFAWRIDYFTEMVEQQSYPYFWWNGWIYDTKTLQQLCLSEDVK